MLVIRLGELHLHLCFDGQEPAAAVHVGDSPSHDDDAHADDSHSDQDVELLNTALVKKTGADALDLLIVCLAALLLLPALRHAVPLPAYRFFVPLKPAHLLPPLRGPPL
jgi:hypothetical protein